MNKNIINLKFVVPKVGGWLQAKLNDESIQRLWQYIENGGENSRSRLAGNITSSFAIQDIDDWFFRNVLEDLVLSYEANFGPVLKTINYNPCPFMLADFWANKSKSTEFNPLHDHAGLYSFVIWMNIPTNWKDQYELPHVKGTNYPCASDFTFVYHNMLGKTCTYRYHLDASSNGTILLFPAQGMGHMVYPFYETEDERVTISGNIFYDTRNARMLPSIKVH